MRLCTSLLAAVLVIAASTTSAQIQQQVTQGGVLSPRDAAQGPRIATGTAVIRGRVFAGDSRRYGQRIKLADSGTQTLALRLVSPP